MTEVDQTMLLLCLQREMAEMKRKTEETAQKNKQELQVLRRENEEMKKKLGEGGPYVIPTNVVGKSYSSPQPIYGRGDERPTPSPRDRDGRRVVPDQVHPDDRDGRLDPPTSFYQHHH